MRVRRMQAMANQCTVGGPFRHTYSFAQAQILCLSAVSRIEKFEESNEILSRHSMPTVLVTDCPHYSVWILKWFRGSKCLPIGIDMHARARLNTIERLDQFNSLPHC